MDEMSLSHVMSMTNCYCTVLVADPRHLGLVGQELTIKIENVLWIQSLTNGIFRMEMVSGLQLDIQPHYPIL
jgi:hypothetical protein